MAIPSSRLNQFNRQSSKNSRTVKKDNARRHHAPRAPAFRMPRNIVTRTTRDARRFPRSASKILRKRDTLRAIGNARNRKLTRTAEDGLTLAELHANINASRPTKYAYIREWLADGTLVRGHNGLFFMPQAQVCNPCKSVKGFYNEHPNSDAIPHSSENCDDISPTESVYETTNTKPAQNAVRSELPAQEQFVASDDAPEKAADRQDVREAIRRMGVDRIFGRPGAAESPPRAIAAACRAETPQEAAEAVCAPVMAPPNAASPLAAQQPGESTAEFYLRRYGNGLGADAAEFSREQTEQDDERKRVAEVIKARAAIPAAPAPPSSRDQELPRHVHMARPRSRLSEIEARRVIPSAWRVCYASAREWLWSEAQLRRAVEVVERKITQRRTQQPAALLVGVLKNIAMGVNANETRAF